jgi:hypothetical protein
MKNSDYEMRRRKQHYVNTKGSLQREETICEPSLGS